LKELVAGPEAGKKGVAGEKGGTGKAEMLKTEKLKERMDPNPLIFGGSGHSTGV
jgi:hypothetical protein